MYGEFFGVRTAPLFAFILLIVQAGIGDVYAFPQNRSDNTNPDEGSPEILPLFDSIPIHLQSGEEFIKTLNSTIVDFGLSGLKNVRLFNKTDHSNGITEANIIVN